MHPNISEALRYLGVRSDPDGSLHRDMSALASRITPRFPPKWVWRIYPVTLTAQGAELTGSGVILPGRTAEKMLATCPQAALLVCTLGAAFDSYLRAEQLRDMHTAVMLDALGSAWVEAGCDAAQEEIRARFPAQYQTDRFSPGYGDLPLSVQPSLLNATDAARRVGVHDTPAHLMTPQKSVTAVIGLSDVPQMARIRGCAYCALNKTCTLRKAGTPCGI